MLASENRATPRTAAGKACIGMFSGIGGLELGLSAAGFQASMMCEIDPHATEVLGARFEDVELVQDVRRIEMLPTAEVVAAGFPCQDLSQAGRTQGITGTKSGIVETLLALLKAAPKRPEWLLIENVPFMLKLGRGAAIAHVTSELARLGYAWAYRVVDSRAFGLPQRRRRVYLLASQAGDPRVIHIEDAGSQPEPIWNGGATGFYWTEGNTGLGWVPGGIPTLKGGSGLGIPSAPAIWFPDGRIGTPDIRDAERLQGFESGWTEAAQAARGGARWRLVGNAVSVPVAKWVGSLIANPPSGPVPAGDLLNDASTWPDAAWGANGKRYRVDCSAWPQVMPRPDIQDFLEHQIKPLSLKATSGFYSRLQRSTLRRPGEFDLALKRHIAHMKDLQS